MSLDKKKKVDEHNLPELSVCPDCNGKLGSRELFHWVPCGTCMGLGRVVKETGEPLAMHLGYPALVKILRRQRLSIKEAKEQIAQLKELVPVGEYSSPYQGSGDYKGD